jgi:hypothetical protein
VERRDEESDRPEGPPAPGEAESFRRARVSRRDVLAGGMGGVLGLGVGFGGGSAFGPGRSSGPPTEAPYVIGAPDRTLPHGVVRADLRAFAAGLTSDFHSAFATALQRADALYVPPGIWPIGQPIDVGRGKVLWSDAPTVLGQIVSEGAIVRAHKVMPAAVRLTGWGATVAGVTVDGADLADSAIEFAADGLFLNDTTAVRGASYSLKATGDFCRIWGGRFSQSGSKGYSMYQKGSDLLMWGTSVSRGSVPLWVGGSGCVFGVMHVVGIGGESIPPSIATVRVTGVRNQFVDVYYDTAGGGPNLLLDQGANNNRFIGMTIRNRWADGSVPAIRCDARASTVQDNHFEAFMTDSGGGAGWSYLLEQLGNPGNLRGNVLGTGHGNGCAALWNARPTIVGDISINGGLSRNAGTVAVVSGRATVEIAHGLAGRPRSLSVDLSRGSVPRPDISPDETSIVLRWRRPPGGVELYWRAEL